MNTIDVLIISVTICAGLFGLWVAWDTINTSGELFPKATGDTLDCWASLMGLARERYGADIDTKPNGHCFWLETPEFVFGWVENDDRLRGRILVARRMQRWEP